MPRRGCGAAAPTCPGGERAPNSENGGRDPFLNKTFQPLMQRASEGEELASIPGVRIWGPVPETQAVRAGALAAASSVLIAPRIAPAGLYERLTALVPDEVLPKIGDTAAEGIEYELTASCHHLARTLWYIIGSLYLEPHFQGSER